jgi:Response regulator containing CheY-like receiver and SARP domains
MLRICVLDDENHALERFKTVVESFEDIELCGLFGDDDELLEFIEHDSPDAVFLDIEMPGKSGMQLAEELRIKHPKMFVIFVTAYSQYAVDAFELSVSDYIMKPISGERLRKTFDRIIMSKGSSEREAKRVIIDCFPRFECRIDGKIAPMNRLMKAKELLAFLVSRKGAETSWEQITEALWPDADYERAHNNLYITTFRLRKWLSENGISEIFESGRNSYRIVPQAFSCDLFEMEITFQKGDLRKLQDLYKGEFLEEDGYEWAYPIQAEWVRRVCNIK